jgi:hypothetical protein
MAGLIEVCVGWFLGIGSSYLFRIYDRIERKNNFINGVQVELQELLPRLVSCVYVLKNSIGQLDHTVLEWANSISSKVQVELFPDHDICIKDLLSFSPDELARASAIMAAQKAGSRPKLKRFYIDYTERNIDILPLMDINLQKFMIEIISRLKLINQEIDHYVFTFDKTFDPECFALNERNMNINLDNSIILISNELMKLADKIIELLLSIRESKYNKSTIKFRKLIAKLDEFIKKRRF